MKKIIVFGATGDIGRYFVNYLFENKYNETYEIIASGTKEFAEFNNNVKYIQADITKKSDFVFFPQKDVEVVVDFAGMMPARMKGYDPEKYIDVNIKGTFNILEYMKKTNVNKILYMQSFGDIKDNAEKNIKLSVNSPSNFSYNSDHSIYVLSKNFAVDMIECYHKMYGISNYIFRLPTIYLYSPIENYYVDGEIRKIGYRILIDKARKGEDIEIWGDVNRKKDMIYVKDLCKMLCLAIKSENSTGHYNVGTGVGTSLLEQIQGIIKVFCDKNKSKIIYRPDKPNAPQYIMNIEDATNELGYIPDYDYISMLEDMKKYFDGEKKY